MANENTLVYLPDKQLFKKSHIGSIEQYKQLYNDSISNNSAFWEKQAKDMLHWQHDFQLVSDCDFKEGLVS